MTENLWTPEDRLLLVWDGQLLVSSSDHICWSGDGAESIQPLAAHPLGECNGRRYWALELAALPALSDATLLPVRQLLGADSDRFELAARALQLVNWFRDHQFCGSCGGATIRLRGENATECQRCNRRFYPRISPCSITLIIRGEYCLLARHRRRQEFFTCLAGFVEVGETVEQCVAREAWEEVKVTVADIRYFASQPWPFPSQLMLGYHAEYQAGEIKPDGIEILEADWFHHDDLPDHPGPHTLAGRLIAEFVRRCRAGLAVPG